ncbi:PH domain-containing protein [Halobellus sp. EA9]|uniref:PH domain-containing protein n=1 Tax=Halobellus sp. EA9 TaxID=3421647 RepID=UPI003EBDD996
MGIFGTDPPEIQHADTETARHDIDDDDLAHVDSTLHEGESVYYCITADTLFVNGDPQTFTGTAYCVVTNTRIVGRQYSGLGNEVTTVVVPHGEITSVSYRSGRLVGKLE